MEFTFTVTEQEADQIIQGLARLPLGEAVGVFNKIQQQRRDQQNPEKPKKK